MVWEALIASVYPLLLVIIHTHIADEPIALPFRPGHSLAVQQFPA